MSDQEIINMLFERTETSLAAIDTKYGKSCRTIAYNIVGNEQDAEECVNDAYLAVWNSIPPEKPNPFAAFLFKILRNIAMKKHRTSQTQKRKCVFEELLAEMEPFLESEETVESQMEKRELARMIEGFLDTLSPENRAVFMRRYWFSESYAEIARAVGISENSVSTRLMRTREKMRKYLNERGILV